MSLEIGYQADYLENRIGFGIKTFLLCAKTVVVNQSSNNLIIFQKESYTLEIEPFRRKPIYIFRGKNAKDKMFNIQMEKEGVVYSSKVPVDFNSFGSLSIYLLNENVNKYIILRIEVMIEKGYTFIKFEDRTDKRDLVFKNNLGITVCIFQKKFADSWYVVLGPREEGEISWVDPYKTKELTIQIYVFDKKIFSKKELKSQRETIRPKKSINNNIFSPLTSLIFEEEKKSKKSLGKPYDQFHIIIERIRKKIIKTSKGKEILINVKLKGSSRVVLIETVRRNIEEKVHEEVDKRIGSSDVFTLIVHFRQIGISFVESFGKNRKELFYLTAQEVNFFGETEEKNLNCQMQVRYLNLDNNFSRRLPFEVGLTTNEPLIGMMNNNHYMFNIIFKVQKDSGKDEEDTQNESILCFEEITVEISPIVLRLDSESLIAFEILGKRVLNVFSDVKIGEMGKYYDSDNHLKKYQWERLALQRDHWIYCKNFSVSLLKTIVTYKKVKDDIWSIKNQNSNQHGILLYSLKNSLPDFDDSPLYFKGIELFYVFESSNGLLSLYLQHLKMQWRMNMMKLVGSLNFLGNPTNLFGNVGNGMVQFVEKPVEGFKKGPLGAVKGGIYGSKALLKNTTVGVMTAVSKFTGSLASGFSTLTQDKEFDRNRKTAKPKNALTGMKNGATSIGRGIWSGATGIFTQPVKGMKKSGAKGFMKGMFKGITGVVTKPVSGILDAASQTTQGVSGSLTKKEEQPNENRIRPSRVLFSRTKYITQYNRQNTEIFWKAVEIKSSIGSSFLVGAFRTRLKLPKEEIPIVLIITGKNLFCFSEKIDKILLIVSLTSIYNFLSNINEAVIEISCKPQSQIIELQIVCLVESKTVTIIINDMESKIEKIIKTILTAKYFI
jgi:vacuolar protein sorting-associated protein 13A/C